jgi:hypothetical protein
MAGFLDSKERIIDMVLTDVGRSLLLKGDLRFRYWIPYDDEVDYNPQVLNSASLTPTELQDRKLQLIEEPVVREATLGYGGLNKEATDTTNVIRPMFTAPPGVGHNYGLPRATVDRSSLAVTVNQKKLSKLYEQRDSAGNEVVKTTQVDVGYQRSDSNEEVINASFPDDAFPDGTQLEGFLATVYLSSSDGYEEILSNRDSAGGIVYRNDIHFDNHTP